MRDDEVAAEAMGINTSKYMPRFAKKHLGPQAIKGKSKELDFVDLVTVTCSRLMKATTRTDYRVADPVRVCQLYSRCSFAINVSTAALRRLYSSAQFDCSSGA